MALALPLFACVLALTAAPIIDTVRLSLTAPLDRGEPVKAVCDALHAKAREAATRRGADYPP